MAKPLKKIRKDVQKSSLHASPVLFFQRRFFVQSFLVIISISFAILTFLAKQNAYFPIDLTITRFIQRITFPPFSALMNILTFLGNMYPANTLVIAALLFLLVLRRFREALFLFISTFGAYELGVLLKAYVARSRPDPTLIHQVTKFIRHDSFPSGHVLFYMGFFGFIAFLCFSLLKTNKIRVWVVAFFLLLIALIGPSRIYLGAHWFSDVLGAYLIGSLWLTLVIYIYNRTKPKVLPKKV